MHFPHSTYQRALGDNLLELWVAGAGMNVVSNAVQSWRGVLRGLTFNAVTAARAPTYAVDGSYFKGRPVVQFSKQVSPPTGFGQLNVPALGLATDVGTLFVVGRMRIDTSAVDFECLMEAYTVSGGIERTINLNFNEDSGTQNSGHGYITEVYTYNPSTPPSYHIFPGPHLDYGVPHLIHGSNGFGGSIGAFCGRDQTIISGTGAPYALGQVQWLSLGLEPRIDRGCNFNMAMAGWCRNAMTPAQIYAFMQLLANEWGTPLPT